MERRGKRERDRDKESGAEKEKKKKEGRGRDLFRRMNTDRENRGEKKAGHLVSAGVGS